MGNLAKNLALFIIRLTNPICEKRFYSKGSGAVRVTLATRTFEKNR